MAYLYRKNLALPKSDNINSYYLLSLLHICSKNLAEQRLSASS